MNQSIKQSIVEKKLLFTSMNKLIEYKLYLFNLNAMVDFNYTKYFLLNVHKEMKIDRIIICFIIRYKYVCIITTNNETIIKAN